MTLVELTAIRTFCVFNKFSFIHVEQHLQQLSGLQRRLEELENNQQQQLQELTPPLDRDREQDRRLAPPDSLSNLWPFTLCPYGTRVDHIVPSCCFVIFFNSCVFSKSKLFFFLVQFFSWVFFASYSAHSEIASLH